MAHAFDHDEPAPAPPEAVSLYDRDFFVWTQEEAERLRTLAPAGIDYENVAEEIESLGKRDRRSIESRLEVVLHHLLKWEHQPEKRKNGWYKSISDQRYRIMLIIQDSPSLRPHPEAVLARAYGRARRNAASEMHRRASTLPETCPYTAEQALNDAFWPGPPSATDDLPN